MKINYLYIDDDVTNDLQPLIQSIESQNKDLKIQHELPLEFAAQIKHIESLIKTSKIDGLILDLRLDQNRQAANYRGTSLAQELRTTSTEKRIPDIPIVLLSMRNRYNKSYRNDHTSHDLYDAAYIKDSIGVDLPASTVSSELMSLAIGYKKLNKSKGNDSAKFASQILSLNSAEVGALDNAILAALTPNKPMREVARFIVKELIKTPGPLIDEKVIAARLGVDIMKSKDWNKLKGIIAAKTSYKGIFSDAWPRWWAHSLEKWWSSIKWLEKGFERLEARERVDAIKKLTGLKKLDDAKPIQNNYSTRFRTVCLGFEMPLDPVDGVLARDDKGRAAWQDKDYISIRAALEKVKWGEGLRVHPDEEIRLSEYKKLR